MVITTLAHHIDLAWMYEAYRQTRKSGAVGVDKVTAEEYAADLESNLSSLLDRFKSGTYFAPPVRRVEIPKPGTRQKRPLGIPTVLDRVIQQAIAQVLTPVYEEQFSSNSYGFRPGRSAHDAVKQVRTYIGEGYRCAVDMDLAKFFDLVNHDVLIHRVARNI